MNHILLQCIPEYDRILYCSTRVDNWHRSWIVFKYFILYDDELRNMVSGGFTPWLLEGNSAFSFSFPWCNLFRPVAEMPLDSMIDEWNSMFEKWVEVTLLSPYFEVFRTMSMGLGVRSKGPIPLYALADQIPGFAHSVEGMETFETLHQLHHISLIRLTDAEGQPFNGFLYGPLSLVNSELGSRLQFSNINPRGGISYWNFLYSWGIRNVIVEDGIEMMVPFSTLSLNPSDNDDDDDANFQSVPEISVLEHQGVDINSNLKFVMFRRVIIESLTMRDWMNRNFIAGQEVFVDYDFML